MLLAAVVGSEIMASYSLRPFGRTGKVAGIGERPRRVAEG